MGIFEWFDGEVPENLETKQVYGIVFSRDARVLLRIEDTVHGSVYSMGGGTPEPFDTDRVATLRREMIEELNTTLEDTVILVGYQEVNEPSGIPAYAQVRMTALIKEIGEAKPDPDNGKTYKRVLVPPHRAIELLNWSDTGKAQIESAFKIAKANFEFESFSITFKFCFTTSHKNCYNSFDEVYSLYRRGSFE